MKVLDKRDFCHHEDNTRIKNKFKYPLHFKDD